MAVKLGLVIHNYSCIWILVGSKDDIRTDGPEGEGNGNISGWVTNLKGNHIAPDPDSCTHCEPLPEALWRLDIYLTAIYFSVSTATTVGYGDFYGSTTYERLFLLPAEFVGICVFSVISGITGNLLELPTLQKIINEKKNDVKMYL